jgi:methylated-DNA-[protein]-cysteine S-methyltransferase
MFETTCDSPVGPLVILSTDQGVCALRPAEMKPKRAGRTTATATATPTAIAPGDPHDARALLGAYFSGDIEALDALAVDLHGTAFELRVWRALRQIPAGTTESYGALAKRLGRPTAARAVGAANGRNPVMLAVPCHRVIGASGALTGFAAGIERKRFLLAFEARIVDERRPSAPWALTAT